MERQKDTRAMNMTQEIVETPVLTPVAAYDAFAPFYAGYAGYRAPYLRKIEDLVIAHAPAGGALLDVGAGDGSRALEIARSAKLRQVVLLEPSAGMRARCPEGIEIWPCSAEDVPDVGPFDAITCLWNVLGHLEGTEHRLSALRKFRKLLTPGGMIFLDVSHRYNAESYGWRMTLLRMAGDFFLRSKKQSDVTVTWRAGERTIRTTGHVFTHREVQRLVRPAGLRILRRWIISYETGRASRLPFCGHLLYQLAAA
jgi:SAM-dependent methyltransferase